MQINAADALRHISNNDLPSFILVFGDEPQQKLDVIDAVRAKAKQQGFDERQSLTLDSDFEWSQLSDAMTSMSLFSEKQYIELSMLSSKPGTQGAKQFLELSTQTNPDVVLLIHGPKAGKDVQKTKWFSSLAQHGWFIHVYELQHQQLTKWLSNRAKQLNVPVSPNACAMIADLCEGNVMAGRQELEKLNLLFDGDKTIDENDVAEVMVQQSRFSSFQFSDELLKGDIRKAINILARLENEGIEPVVILWSLVNEAQTLTKMFEMQQTTGRVDFRALRIWPNKQSLYSTALGRFDQNQLQTLRHELSSADVMLKSQYVAKPYVLLSHLAVLFGNQSQAILSMPLND